MMSGIDPTAEIAAAPLNANRTGPSGLGTSSAFGGNNDAAVLSQQLSQCSVSGPHEIFNFSEDPANEGIVFSFSVFNFY